MENGGEDGGNEDIAVRCNKKIRRTVKHCHKDGRQWLLGIKENTLGGEREGPAAKESE